jgi:hypothetical protein
MPKQCTVMGQAPTKFEDEVINCYFIVIGEAVTGTVHLGNTGCVRRACNVHGKQN